MPLNFTVVDINPNDTTGGGGSLADPMHDVDATGPWFVWPNQEMESAVSPFCVVAASEVRAMYRALDDEVIAGGETNAQRADVDAQHPYESVAITGQGPGAEDEVDYNDPEAFTRAFASKE